jgi:hypothetical protein
MAAAAGATGVRSWLQVHHLTWLTPRRLRIVTIGLMVVAFAVSSIGVSGAGAPMTQGSMRAVASR